MRDMKMNSGAQTLTMKQDFELAQSKDTTATAIVASNGFVVEIMTPE